MPRIPDPDAVSPVTGWSVAGAPPGRALTSVGLDALSWLPARVPGTVASALRDAGQWADGDRRDLDAEDWWFRAAMPCISDREGAEVVLRLGGVATLAEVFINGEQVLQSHSMFAAHEIALGASLQTGGADLTIRCRALGPELDVPKSPRARWRSRIAAGGLRHHRTMLLGRAPGFAPSPAAVGPWRDVTVERRRDVVFDKVRLRTSLRGNSGCLAVEVKLRGLGGVTVTSVTVEVSGVSPTCEARLILTPTANGVVAAGEIDLPRVERWWPHTHGEPTLHDVRLLVETGASTIRFNAGRVGFRELAPGPSGHEVETDGLDLRVNDVAIFARGAIWTPLDLVGLAPTEAALRAVLVRVRDAGMNMLRVVGLGAYESATFHDLCDELGILVWQDFMFANFDYPVSDETFRMDVEAEARAVLADLAWRPSLAILCGNSEVEQQAAMLGLSWAVARGELFGGLLPKLVSGADVDAVYIPSSPCGGDLPFHPGQGIANYFGVGGYRRPLDDARFANVRFAGECLAFANLPDDAALCDINVPRDVGATWDFADVRDHYLEMLYGIDAIALHHDDPARYFELGRATSGEVMADVFGEWRRAASSCRGGLVLWLTDVGPGAGWGVLDVNGLPKVAFSYLRRALSPVAIWMTDEGLGGLDIHVANDRADPLRARLRVARYGDHEVLVEEAVDDLHVAGHGTARRGVEELLGRFVDASYAYRFGPLGADVVVASLERRTAGVTELVAQAFWFPAGRPSTAVPPGVLGLRATSRRDGADLVVTVGCTRLAYCVRVHAPGYDLSDDAFSVEPGRQREVRLRPNGGDRAGAAHRVTAANLVGDVDVEQEPSR